MVTTVSNRGTSYKDAGVDIDEADRAVSAIRKMARATFTKGVLTDIGSFGGCFALPKMKHPVLVSSVDGVGTKLKIAFATGRHDTIGEDLVNHCVNDIAVQGAKPLFFLDYLAVGRLEAGVAAKVVSGIARGCKANGCALIGGETAEMPGMYSDGEYDLAGAIVGAVEKRRLSPARRWRPGTPCWRSLPPGCIPTATRSRASFCSKSRSSRRSPGWRKPASILADELLQVHRSYLKPIQALVKAGTLAGAAHITGGGITDNLPRVLPKRLAAAIDTGSWQTPPLFEMLRSIGQFRKTTGAGRLTSAWA